MTPGFSLLYRKNLLSRLQVERFDLLVIGGGVTGAGVALDAASRGLKVALIEKNDFASGTSGKSTKLIHGGLRYLKQFEFGLVKEVGSERAVVHNLAPHLVVPGKMLLPLTGNRSLNNWITSVGLGVYDWLAGVSENDQHRMLSRFQTIRYEPLLRRDIIKAGAYYAEYRTDDARLTLEIIKTAFRYGVTTLNYLRAINFVYDNEKITGINATDELTSESLIIHATAVVSATGPWVDDLRAINKSKTKKRIALAKGSHIVIPYEKIPLQQAIYFNAPDGRMIFAIPRGRATYIGTTDINYNGDKDHITATREEVDYLVDAINTMFPTVRLSVEDIESSWAGLRSLIYKEGKSSTELSRRDEIFESPSGLISIAGGKLTGYRKMAERVVDLVTEKYFNDRTLKKCHTDEIKLTGNNFTSYNDVRNYRLGLRKKIEPMGFTVLTAHYLIENYGKQTDQIWKHFEELHSPSDEPELSLLKAELWFCVHHEMVVSLQDFFIRRTGLLYFDIDKVKKWKEEIANTLASYLSWTDTRKETELQHLDKLLEEASTFS